MQNYITSFSKSHVSTAITMLTSVILWLKVVLLCNKLIFNVSTSFFLTRPPKKLVMIKERTVVHRCLHYDLCNVRCKIY